jgi:type VI secretion system secreted protein VgrG
MIIPRIGMEVLIDFINGNPDRPVVVGRLYNAANMPVYALPEHKTKAVWRSKTYKRTESEIYPSAQPGKIESEHPAANEIRFEDKTGAEELYVHAEKDLNTRVRNDETHFVAKDQTIKIWNNQITEVHKDRTEEVWGDEKITLHQNRVETVTANETVTINGNRSVTISGNDALTAGGNIAVTSSANIAITATSKITLTCGQSSIELSPTGIKINSVDVEANGQATAKMTAGAQLTLQASGITTIQGAMVKIN